MRSLVFGFDTSIFLKLAVLKPRSSAQQKPQPQLQFQEQMRHESTNFRTCSSESVSFHQNLAESCFEDSVNLKFLFPRLIFLFFTWRATAYRTSDVSKADDWERGAGSISNLGCVTTGNVRCWHEHPSMLFLTAHWAQRPSSDRIIYLCGLDPAAIWACACVRQGKEKKKTHEFAKKPSNANLSAGERIKILNFSCCCSCCCKSVEMSHVCGAQLKHLKCAVFHLLRSHVWR